jgi:hypothetical protein
MAGLVVMGMIMGPIVIVGMILPVTGGVMVIPGRVIGPAPQVHHRPEPPYASPEIPDKIEFPALKPQFAQFRPEEIGIHPQIHQGAQAHIAGDPGVTVKMQGSQTALHAPALARVYHQVGDPVNIC